MPTDIDSCFLWVISGGAEAAPELPDLARRPLHAEQCGDTAQRRQWRAQERGHVRATPDHDEHCRRPGTDTMDTWYDRRSVIHGMIGGLWDRWW